MSSQEDNLKRNAKNRMYITCVKLNKAFDTVRCDRFWKTMNTFGCPSRFIAIVRQCHDDMQAHVQKDG